ncbi:DsbA family protein [Escherichia coli]|nr:DsbA family protein [Escherichia coli]
MISLSPPTICNSATLSTNLQLARLVGVQGTPATIIGDEMIPGAVSWETLEAVVKEKLAVAHAQ